MARTLPPCSEAGELVAQAQARLEERRLARGIGPARVAQELGYEDLQPVSSFVTGADGARTPLKYEPAELHQIHVAYQRLQAYQKAEAPGVQAAPSGAPSGWGEPGWGVRSLVHIGKGQVVAELVGEWLDAAAGGVAADRRWLLGFDEAMMARKRAANDPHCYLDCRRAGSIARLMNTCAEAPNLELRAFDTPAPAAVAAEGGFPLSLSNTL